MALELDLAADGLDLEVPGELRRDVTAHRTQALLAQHSGSCHLGAHRRDVDLALLRDLDAQLRIPVVPGVRQHDLDDGAAVLRGHVHALDTPLQPAAPVDLGAIPADHPHAAAYRRTEERPVGERWE